jgi:hypothetical protein
MNLLKQLEGKRTYIIAAIIAILNLLVAFDVISPEQIETINIVLGSLGLATLRAAKK